MSIKTLHHLPNELYFYTFTCTNWLSLFEITQSYDEVYKWLTIAYEKKFRTCAFVIMPNHFHYIMATPSRKANLNTLVKIHQVFKPSFDARLILDEKMLFQKMDYIHNNPVRGKWNLVSDFVLYPHSSAAFYELGASYQFPITHYSKILYGD
jgi:REP element-mobilizing transposase RayT